jgi:uncharacterized protein
MKTSIEHLPDDRQERLGAVVAIFREVVPQGLLVLFGSHARGDWVDDEVTGYRSDFDLLAVVRDPKQAGDLSLWHRLEARFREAAAPTPVALIAHDFKFVNREIRMGQYFFSDIANEGVLLYAGEKLDFATPKALNDRERLQLGAYNYGYWFHSASEFFRGCRYYAARGELNHAAFLLHQAAERYYHAASLVLSGYKERTHDLNALGQKASDQHPLLVEALPKAAPEDERLHTLLRKAYIEARYSKSYRITLDELTTLQQRVLGLACRVREACLEKLASFCGPAAVSTTLPTPPAPDEPPALPPEWVRAYSEAQRAEGKAEGLREGEAKGLREGEAKGRREGEARGEVKGKAAALVTVLAARGLAIDGETRERIEGCADAARLDRWLVRAMTAASAREAVDDGTG